jgi:2,4-dienoyl-CoA reductase-like NADH-dependent reductase (Old Yellow Enzyme family)/thioredoxin reductase
MNDLFRPVRIGGLALKNRAVMPAMGTGYGTAEGEVSDRLLAYLRQRAEGGVGLIVTEVCAVHPLGKGFPRELQLYDDSCLRGMEKLTRTVRHAGAAVAAQLHHAGRQTFPQVIEAEPVAPSAIPSRALGVTPRELSVKEIEELIGCYASAAVRARDAGFDAVEIHGAHGYLVNQFLSPYSNKRKDEYGLPPLGRVHFAREIVREIKREAGKDFPVLFRISSSELVRGGYEIEYLLPFLRILEEEGVDAFHVSCGVYDSPGNPTCPGWHHPPGLNLERAEKVKQTVKVPVIVAGKLHDPRLAAQAIAAGQADMVAFGRQHLADPLFLDKAAAGRPEDICTCLSCNQGCIERLTFTGQPITCTINPGCGEEERETGRQVERAGRFLVVGAGPAGLQAALTLGEAGARVEVREREAEPGGQLRAASRPEGKQPLADWVAWMEKRLASLGVSLLLGREASPEDITDTGWDGVIVATGSRPVLPDIPGGELPKVVEAREVLLGRSEVGRQVLIVGAGPVGLETADLLIASGCEVSVVEERSYSPVNQLSSQGYHLHRRIREAGRLFLDTRVIAITPEGAVLLREGRDEEIPVDTVIWAVGSDPENWLAGVAEEMAVPSRTAGDAVEPRTILEATREGRAAALDLL